jgi:hypothetical protein
VQRPSGASKFGLISSEANVNSSVPTDGMIEEDEEEELKEKMRKFKKRHEI